MMALTDIKLDSNWQLTPAANGDMLTVTDFDLLLQDISLEAMSQERELFYDEEWGWSLIDFMQSQLDELTKLEIEQRIKIKMGRRQEVDSSNIKIDFEPYAEQENVLIKVLFRFLDSSQDYSLGVVLDRVKVEVVIV
jgi:hypothetical protein